MGRRSAQHRYAGNNRVFTAVNAWPPSRNEFHRIILQITFFKLVTASMCEIKRRNPVIKTAEKTIYCEYSGPSANHRLFHHCPSTTKKKKTFRRYGVSQRTKVAADRNLRHSWTLKTTIHFFCNFGKQKHLYSSFPFLLVVSRSDDGVTQKHADDIDLLTLSITLGLMWSSPAVKLVFFYVDKTKDMK